MLASSLPRPVPHACSRNSMTGAVSHLRPGAFQLSRPGPLQPQRRRQVRAPPRHAPRRAAAPLPVAVASSCAALGSPGPSSLPSPTLHQCARPACSISSSTGGGPSSRCAPTPTSRRRPSSCPRASKRSWARFKWCPTPWPGTRRRGPPGVPARRGPACTRQRRARRRARVVPGFARAEHAAADAGRTAPGRALPRPNH
jgi:hypothetical protein